MGKPWSQERRRKWAEKKTRDFNKKWGDHMVGNSLNAEAVSVDNLSEEKGANEQ